MPVRIGGGPAGPVQVPADVLRRARALPDALSTSSPDVMTTTFRGRLVSWLNEWGALRGVSPFSWGDALVRAIRQDGDGITAGNALELEDRRTGRATDKLWARRWTDGRLVRHGHLMGEVYVQASGATTPTGLPEGTVVVEYTP